MKTKNFFGRMTGGLMAVVGFGAPQQVSHVPRLPEHDDSTGSNEILKPNRRKALLYGRLVKREKPMHERSRRAHRYGMLWHRGQQ